jgi:hypothetical protein
MASSSDKKPAAAGLLDKERLLKQVRRMNSKSEQERDQRKEVLEARIAELRDGVASCSATMQRLRGERDGDEYMGAKARRDEMNATIQQLLRELDPQTEFERVNEALTAAAAKVRKWVGGDERRGPWFGLCLRNPRRPPHPRHCHAHSPRHTCTARSRHPSHTALSRAPFPIAHPSLFLLCFPPPVSAGSGCRGLRDVGLHTHCEGGEHEVRAGVGRGDAPAPVGRRH